MFIYSRFVYRRRQIARITYHRVIAYMQWLMNNELDMKWIQPVVVRFDAHPVLVLRSTCVPEKVGVTSKGRK